MRSLGQIGFEAYNESTGGKTFDGRPIPPWSQVETASPHVVKAWSAAGEAIASEIRKRSISELLPVPGDTRLTFSSALIAIKAGHRVARKGWNGKGMWIALTRGSTFPGSQARSSAASGAAAAHAKLCAEAGEYAPVVVRIGGHIDMLAADGVLEVGWRPTSRDMLADDWCVVE